MTRHVHVGVSPPEFFGRNASLFGLLEKLFPVRIEPRPGDCTRFGDASIALGLERASAIAASQPDTPCLAFVDATVGDAHPSRRTTTFARGPDAPPTLRGRTIEELRAAGAASHLTPAGSDAVIAVRDGEPAWLMRRGADGARLLDISAVPLPALTAHDYLVDHFGRAESMGLLPLLDFLQRLSDTAGWQAPPARACIVFDDVNVRDTSYGCLVFNALASHASASGYHAAIAMIPLDAGRACPETVALFRSRPHQLSMLVHGNNHQRLELARPRTQADLHALVAQALQRSRAFGEEHGMPIDAVMEPPYGTVHVDYLDPLAHVGFEAVLVTPRQFRTLNPATDRTALLGMSATETWPNGLAMIPRITADAGWRNDVLLAGFLRQPIVIAGHHFDADDDLHWVDEIGQFVNSVQPHSWCSLSTIARSQYARRWVDRTLHVRCGSRFVDVEVPSGTEAVVVERPWLGTTGQEALQCSASTGHEALTTVAGPTFGPLAVRAGDALAIRSPGPPRARDDSPAARPTAYKLKLRRAITETRDRFYPRLPRTFRRKSALVDRRT